jgi:hypothetical protein
MADQERESIMSKNEFRSTWAPALAVALTLAAGPLQRPAVAQEPDLTTVDAAVTTLYGSLSFDPGEEPDWAFVRGLFVDRAVVVFAEGAGGPLRTLTADGFIEDFQQFYADARLVERGFSEIIEAREITEFGNLAQVFVVFQPHVAGQPAGRRGLDCLQMTRVDGRWRITSIITDWEGPSQPIPERFATGGG